MQDYKDLVDACVKEMETANVKGDVRRVYYLVKKLSNKPKPPPTNLTTDSNGNLLESPKDMAERWGVFLREKFKSTPEEAVRPPMPPLPPTRTPEDALTRTEFDQAMKRLNNSKTTGPDARDSD